MKKEYLKFSREIKAIIIIILILTIIFGFNDNKPEFILKDWLLNLLYVLILVSMIILFNALGYKLVAKYLGAEIEIKVLNSHVFKGKFRLLKLYKYVFKPVLPVLITLFFNGKFFFTPIGTFDIKDYNIFGRKFPKITYFNHGLIAAGGLFFNFILMLIFKLAGLDKGILISSWFIVWQLLPFSNLPGAKIFLASRTLYVFSLIFFIGNILLIQSLPVIYAIILSLLVSIILAVIYFYFLEYLKA